MKHACITGITGSCLAELLLEETTRSTNSCAAWPWWIPIDYRSSPPVHIPRSSTD